jgi:hypothetical protein
MLAQSAEEPAPEGAEHIGSVSRRTGPGGRNILAQLAEEPVPEGAEHIGSVSRRTGPGGAKHISPALQRWETWSK